MSSEDWETCSLRISLTLMQIKVIGSTRLNTGATTSGSRARESTATLLCAGVVRPMIGTITLTGLRLTVIERITVRAVAPPVTVITSSTNKRIRQSILNSSLKL